MEQPLMEYVQIDPVALEHLARRDKRLGAVIAALGEIQRRREPRLFHSLIRAVVGQQISTKAQEAIYGRMLAGIPSFTPAALASLPAEELRAFGLSGPKTAYIHDIAARIAAKEVDLDQLAVLSDKEVEAALVALKGIGPWTAEMLMLFSMGRPDIFSFLDLGIHRGLRMIYRKKEITPAFFETLRRRYAPYGSAASLYIWAVAGGAMPTLTDPGTPRQKKKTDKKMPPIAKTKVVGKAKTKPAVSDVNTDCDGEVAGSASASAFPAPAVKKPRRKQTKKTP